MHWLILALLLVGALFGPQLRVQAVMRRHDAPRADFPGSGGELARHLPDRPGLGGIAVGATDQGDYYDPVARTVRLSDAHFNGRSLTGVVIAAHEVGHAMQDASGYRPLRWRHRLVGFAQSAQRLGKGLIVATRLIAAVTRMPGAGLRMLAGVWRVSAR